MYLHSFPDQNRFNQYINYDFGCGEIRPAYTVHLQLLLQSWRNKLQELDAIREEQFDLNELKTSKELVSYQTITAKKIIFCDGPAGVNSPWFQLLPYAPNKGEALVIESIELTNEHIFKKGLMLAPLPGENIYWVGSNYQWEFEDDQPSQQFYEH